MNDITFVKTDENHIENLMLNKIIINECKCCKDYLEMLIKL